MQARLTYMSRTHYLSDEQVHYKWDTTNEPALTIDSGDTSARVPASAAA